MSGIGTVSGAECMIGADDPTVKGGGAVGPSGVAKQLRMLEIAERNRLPLISLTESAGADLPRQADIFVPGGAWFKRISRLSAAGIPTLSIVFGSSTAGGAYVPGMSESTVMVRNQAAVYLGGLKDLGPDSVRVAVGGVERLCRVRVADDTVVWVDDSDGGHSAWKPTPRFPEDADASAGADGAADVPGTVVAIAVAAGDRVLAGQVLVTMAAMKMEHQVKAGRDAVVASVDCAVGQFVDAHQVLVTLT